MLHHPSASLFLQRKTSTATSLNTTAYGQTDETAGDYAEDLAATMLATTMGIQFDPETAWDERKKIFKTTGLIIKTANTTQSAAGDKNGLWTTTVAAAVFVPAENGKPK